MFASPFYADNYRQQQEDYHGRVRERENERLLRTRYNVSPKELEEEARMDGRDYRSRSVYVRSCNGHIYKILENDLNRREHTRQKENKRFQKAYYNYSEEELPNEEEDMSLDKCNSQSRYVHIRGNDGRIYKVVKDDRSGKDRTRLQDRKSCENKNSSASMGYDTPTARKADEDHEQKKSKNVRSWTRRKNENLPASTACDTPKVKEVNEQRDQLKSKNVRSWSRRMKSARSRKMGKKFEAEKNYNVETYNSSVLVEDASDSEMEDERKRAVWCNRRPSPGEWMEPVEHKFYFKQ